MAIVKRSLIAFFILTQVTACGTLLYPERRGQTTGQIDVGVAALNALGLVLFFVPGVVAFGVDFITGAIYLPNGGLAQLTDDELKAVQKNANEIDVHKLKKVMAQRTDPLLPENAYMDKWHVSSMNSPHDLKLSMSLYGKQVAFK